MRKILLVFIGLWLCGLTAKADTFQLTDGRTLTGEPLYSTATEAGMKIKTGDGEYSDVPWGSFSQEDLKKMMQQPKLAPLVEPFIEITQAEKLKKTEVEIKPVARLGLPESRSLFAAMFSNGLGVLMMLLLYAANLYAAYEISIFRARPAAVVCGVAAVLPVAGPIIFLSLPTVVEPQPESVDAVAAEAAAGSAEQSPAGAPGTVEGQSAAEAGGLRLAHAEAPTEGAVQLPPTQTFQRGAFTFNRRFFETKFTGFIGVIKREADKDMVLVIKSARGDYTGQRIVSVAANDLRLQVNKGNASEEVMIPFTEIKEVQLKHKDAA